MHGLLPLRRSGRVIGEGAEEPAPPAVDQEFLAVWITVTKGSSTVSSSTLFHKLKNRTKQKNQWKG